MLIQKAQPDRLLIEPTGLGHPRQILETLQSEFSDQLQAHLEIISDQSLDAARLDDLLVDRLIKARG